MMPIECLKGATDQHNWTAEIARRIAWTKLLCLHRIYTEMIIHPEWKNAPGQFWQSHGDIPVSIQSLNDLLEHEENNPQVI